MVASYKNHKSELIKISDSIWVLVIIAVDLLENPKLVEKVKSEYIQRKHEEKNEPIIPDGPSPISGN